MSWEAFFELERVGECSFFELSRALHDAWRDETPGWSAAAVERQLRAHQSHTYLLARVPPSQGIALKNPGDPPEHRNYIYSLEIHARIPDDAAAAARIQELCETSMEENLVRLEQTGMLTGVSGDDVLWGPALERGVRLTLNQATQLSAILHHLGIEQ